MRAVGGECTYNQERVDDGGSRCLIIRALIGRDSGRASNGAL
jgi:hypothetical protein